MVKKFPSWSPVLTYEPVPLPRWSLRSPPRRRRRRRWCRRGCCCRRATSACGGRTTAAPASSCPPTATGCRLENGKINGWMSVSCDCSPCWIHCLRTCGSEGHLVWLCAELLIKFPKILTQNSKSPNFLLFLQTHSSTNDDIAENFGWSSRQSGNKYH